MSVSITLEQLFHANNIFIAAQREINASLVNTYLGVAIWSAHEEVDEPLSITALSKRVGMSPTTVSRHLRYLGHHQRKGVPGLGLVTTYYGPDDARSKYVKLTTEGQAMLSRLLMIAA